MRTFEEVEGLHGLVMVAGLAQGADQQVEGGGGGLRRAQPAVGLAERVEHRRRRRLRRGRGRRVAGGGDATAEDAQGRARGGEGGGDGGGEGEGAEVEGGGVRRGDELDGAVGGAAEGVDGVGEVLWRAGGELRRGVWEGERGEGWDRRELVRQDSPAGGDGDRRRYRPERRAEHGGVKG